jgi:gluconokinase
LKAPAPVKLVVMGVAGSGKSALAERLSQRLGCALVEGDDHHLPSSQAKMAAGIALDDADREPWLARLGALLGSNDDDAVLTCSALKRAYRDRLRGSVPGLRVVHHDIDLQTALQRVASRSGHLFPKSLVTSQFAALESPAGEAGVLEVSALLQPGAQVDAVLRWLAVENAAVPRSEHA